MSNGFVALQESRHEEFLRQCGQANATQLAIFNHAARLIGIDHFDHRARHRRVINDAVVVRGIKRLVAGESHQCIAVSRHEFNLAFEQLLACEAMKLRRELRAAAEHTLDPILNQRDFLA